MLLFLREIFCTYLMMSFTLALSLPAGDGGEDTSSPCSQKCSSIKNSSASGVQYSLEVSLPTYTPGWPTEVKLHSTACLKDYDQSTTVGPAWYRLEAFFERENETEEEAPGQFSLPYNMVEAFHCNQTVVFKSIKPSLLDLPGAFYWTPGKYSYCNEENRRPVCFRATIQQYGEPQCQTVKKCIGMTPNTFKCIPVFAAPPAIIPTIASVPVAAPPSQQRIDKCLEKWGCENAKPKYYCGSNGITFSSRCLWRRYKCIHRVEVPIVKGTCPTTPTPTPTPTPLPLPTSTSTTISTSTSTSTTISTSTSTSSPSPSPTPQCKYFYDKVKNSVDKWHPQCTRKGTAKPVQCHRAPNGLLQCWCVTKNLIEIEDTRRGITNCNSIIDMDCWIF